MGNYFFLLFVFGFIFVLIICKIFVMPVKRIIKLILNSLLGVAFIYIINYFGSNYGFHLGINWWTMFVSGILGIPGVILLIVLKYIL